MEAYLSTKNDLSGIVDFRFNMESLDSHWPNAESEKQKVQQNNVSNCIKESKQNQKPNLGSILNSIGERNKKNNSMKDLQKLVSNLNQANVETKINTESNNFPFQIINSSHSFTNNQSHHNENFSLSSSDSTSILIPFQLLESTSLVNNLHNLNNDIKIRPEILNHQDIIPGNTVQNFDLNEDILNINYDHYDDNHNKNCNNLYLDKNDILATTTDEQKQSFISLTSAFTKRDVKNTISILRH